MVDNTEKMIPFLFSLCSEIRVTAIVSIERISTHLEDLIKSELKDER